MTGLIDMLYMMADVIVLARNIQYVKSQHKIGSVV